LKGYELKPGGTINLLAQLKPSGDSLSQVVVVGYGTQRKANLTGAVDQIGSEYFEDRPLPNLTRGLQGTIANLNIVMTDGKPTRGASYNIRGATSIGSGGNALVLIDGVPGDPNTINPNDIESVTVLKDASSAAIYGARAAFGVVLITTKSPRKIKYRLTIAGIIPSTNVQPHPTWYLTPTYGRRTLMKPFTRGMITCLIPRPSIPNLIFHLLISIH
jgi:TonB-dependent SusC/RagA subfamily outer membrane receptor